jgi:hypothetical protein
MLQSISVNGVDATETPVELTQNISGVVVTFTDQISDVRGAVKGTAPGDDPPAVIVFPFDNTAWKNFGVNPLRMRRTLANAAGNFSLGSLPAGDYFAIAVPEEFSSEWQDPAYLELLARTASRFTLSPGERRTVELSVQDVRPPGIGRPPLFEFPLESIEQGSGPFVPEASPPQQTRDTKPIASQPVAGSISGIVMQDDGPARPARLARVSVRGSAINGERVTLSGDDGAFVVDNLPPGSYQVYVTKPAYLPMYFGATRPARGPGTNVVLDGKKPVAGVNITLTRGAVVTGTVFDIEGQPAPNVRVQMMMVQVVDGERVLANVSFSGTTLTDDRGMFRVYGVRSGTYVMLANPQPPRAPRSASCRSRKCARPSQKPQAASRWPRCLRIGSSRLVRLARCRRRPCRALPSAIHRSFIRARSANRTHQRSSSLLVRRPATSIYGCRSFRPRASKASCSVSTDNP